MKPKPGDTVVLIKLPRGMLDGLLEEDQQAICGIIGKPVLLEKYDEDGRAELRFATSDGHIHFIYVRPDYISHLSEQGPTDAKIKDRQDAMDAVCACLAFLPWLVNAIYIHADIASGPGWQSAFINPISVSALLWLFVTYLHYRRTRTKRAAWLFALFPVAFAAPGLIIYLWFSASYPK
jgi:hypothetical protein